jgi:hypothetical protein
LANFHKSQKSFFAVVILLTTILITDYLLSNIADIISDQLKSNAGIALFIVISFATIAGQLYIVKMIRNMTVKQNLRKSRLGKIVEISQYMLIIVIIIVIIQIIFVSIYFTNILSVSTAISYGITIVIMGSLSWKLLTWFKSSMNLALLLYGLAAGLIALNSIFSIILFDSILMEKPQTVSRQSEVIFSLGFEPGTPMSFVITIQNYSYNAYFLLTWGGTIMLLRHNIHRIGRVRFWVLVSLPIIYFASSGVTLYQEFYPDSTVTKAISENFAIPILVSSASASACGILFGLGFLLIGRSISSGSQVKGYMQITGSGFMLFFTAASATVLQAAYPPFGLPSVSTVSLSAFMIYFGLYYAAIGIANDVKLRQLIRKTLLDKSKLLDSIGDAQMKQEVEKSVLDMVRKTADKLELESGVPPAMSEIEVSQYLQTVISQIKK